MTGYPSIDKPWLKYYTPEAINAEMPKATLYNYAFERNKDHLSDTAFRYYGNKISYGQFFHMVDSAVNALAKLGIGSGDIFTVMSMHIPEAVCLLYAASRVGAVANFVYPTLSDDELLDVLNNTASKALFIMDTFAEAHRRTEGICPLILLRVSDSFPPALKLAYSLMHHKKNHEITDFAELLNAAESCAVKETKDGGIPCAMVYTSGTTGQPKGVMLSSDCMNAVSVQLRESGKDYHHRDTILLFLPPFIGFGIGMLHHLICVGLDITLQIELEHEKIMTEYNKLKPDRIVVGPVLLDPFMLHAKGDMSNLVDFSGGGGATAPEKEREINAFLKSHGARASYAQGYGMTEFASVVTSNQNHALKEGSIGIPLPAVNIRIMDWDSEKELRYHEIGELCVSAPNTMIGYYKMPTETAELFFTDGNGVRWMRTGDLCEMDEDGFIFLRGRLKRIYVTMIPESCEYHKLFPQRVEDTFVNMPEVENCGVTVYEDPVRIHAPRVFVKLKENCDEDVLELLNAQARQKLSAEYFPMEIIPVEEMPSTVGGKIDYKALEKLYENLKPKD